MRTYLWPGDRGWPEQEPDESEDDGLLEWVEDPNTELDEDALCLHAPPPHLWEDLDDVERLVVAHRFGLDGTGDHTLRQLHDDLGLTHAQVRDALASGLGKLRHRLAEA